MVGLLIGPDTCLIVTRPDLSCVCVEQTGDTYTYTFRHDSSGWLCDSNT